jgi:hypothetical protein
MVEVDGIEPTTPLAKQVLSQLSKPPVTADHLRNPASQLTRIVLCVANLFLVLLDAHRLQVDLFNSISIALMSALGGCLVGLAGLEPATPRLSSVCSNQLSYKPYSWLELKSLAQSNSQLLLTQPISVNACNQAFL